MLNVDQYSYIRTAHRVYGKKIKQIARKPGGFTGRFQQANTFFYFWHESVFA